METDLAQFQGQELGPEYRHVKDFVTAAPPPGGYVVKASKNGETAPGYDPYGGDMKIVVDPHLAGSFEFEIPRSAKRQEEFKTMTQHSGVKQFPDDNQRENVITNLRAFTAPPPPPKPAAAEQKVFSAPPINNEAPTPAVAEKEIELPLVETELSFAGSPFSTEACFNDVFEDATKKWLFLVYYNGSTRISRTKINPTNLVLELKIKGREIGYKLDVNEPIIVEFKDFSFIILKIVDAINVA